DDWTAGMLLVSGEYLCVVSKVLQGANDCLSLQVVGETLIGQPGAKLGRQPLIAPSHGEVQLEPGAAPRQSNRVHRPRIDGVRGLRVFASILDCRESGDRNELDGERTTGADQVGGSWNGRGGGTILSLKEQPREKRCQFGHHAIRRIEA